MPVVGSLGICTVAAVDVRSIGGGFILPWAYGLGLYLFSVPSPVPSDGLLGEVVSVPSDGVVGAS